VASLDENVPPAGTAAKADVGPDPIDQPLAPAARVLPAQPKDVAKEQLERGSFGHGRSGYQSRGRPWLGMSSRVVAGRRMSSVGATSIVTSGEVAAIWAMIPPTRVRDPVRASLVPIA
jgi:hypothetical protein